MKNKNFVQFLYRIMFDREPDAAGAAHWLQCLENGMEPLDLFLNMVRSPEFSSKVEENPYFSEAKARNTHFSEIPGIFSEALPLHIVDVGAQLLEDEPHAYASLTDLGGCQVIGFEPLEEAAKARMAVEPHTTIYPFFIGDGRATRFFITHFDATSSIYEPNMPLLEQFVGLSDACRVLKEIQIQTVKLDDIQEVSSCDYLKLDTQGSELDVLRGSTRLLEKITIVHTEVEFEKVYKAQPLFSEVQQFLRRADFELIDIIRQCRCQYNAGKGFCSASSRLMWGEAIFMKSPDVLKREPISLIKAAYMMHVNYSKYDLAAHLLSIMDKVTGRKFLDEYIACFQVQRSF